MSRFITNCFKKVSQPPLSEAIPLASLCQSFIKNFHSSADIEPLHYPTLALRFLPRFKLRKVNGFPRGLRAADFADLRFSFVRGCAPRNHRTQAAPNSSLSLKGKDPPFRFLARSIRLRCSVLLRSLCASGPLQPGERYTPGLSPERQESAAPRPRLVTFSNPLCHVPNLSPSPACFHRGPGAVPPEGDLRWPPCSAGFFVKGERPRTHSSKKKDYENKYTFRFKAPEPDRTAQFGTTASH
jgi:hypothetical protein